MGYRVICFFSDTGDTGDGSIKMDKKKDAAMVA